MAKRKRKKRSKEQLQNASNNLHYEFDMFTRLVHMIKTGSTTSGVINNAILESFTIHTRNLMDFLYAKKPEKGDVIAEDFFDDPVIWLNGRPSETDKLKTARNRVNIEVTHLAYLRERMTPETKKWHILEIVKDIYPAFEKFEQMVPRYRLGSSWNKPFVAR